MDAQQAELGGRRMAVFSGLADGHGPGNRQVAQMAVAAGKRKDVGDRIVAGVCRVQATKLGIAGDSNSDAGRAFGEPGRHLRQRHSPTKNRAHKRSGNRRADRFDHVDRQPRMFIHHQQVNPLESLPVRILVTGGAGFIGSHVVDAYVAAGHQVAVLDNFSTGNEANLNEAAETHRLDLRDQAGVEKLIASFKPDIVNHHAAQSEVPRSVADPGYDAQINIVGGLNVLKASIDHSVKKVIFISTGGALYGEPDVVPAAEDHPVRPLSPYGTSKYSFEQYLGMFKRTFGLEFTVLRYANIYGPRQDFFAEEGRVVAIFASRMLAGKPVTIDGDGEQSRDMLHVGDAATANLAALEHGAGEIFHISSGIAVTINDLFRKLALLTGYTTAPNHGPSRKGDVYRIALDNTRAGRGLGWQPRVDLEEGLSLTVDYFREQVSRASA
jgi:UDP-glucose 4-epimerase